MGWRYRQAEAYTSYSQCPGERSVSTVAQYPGIGDREP